MQGFRSPNLDELLSLSSGMLASLVAQSVKNPPAMQETQVPSLGPEDPLEKGMATPPVFLPGKSHGQRSLAGYIPRGPKRETRLRD